MFGEFRNAFDRHNNAHVQLIIINVVIFFVMIVLNAVLTMSKLDSAWEFVLDIFRLPPTFSEFFHRPWTLLTYAFAHDWSGIWHLLGNMIGLYWFGSLLIEYLGNDKVIAVYVLGALAGAVVFLLMFNFVPYFVERPNLGLIGASAAVFAVMMAIVTLLPDYTFYLMFLGPVKIKYIALFYTAVSIIGTVGQNDGGNLAHLGGLLMGYVYTKQLQAGVNWGGWITGTLDWVKGLFQPSRNVKVTYRKTETSPKKTTAAKQPFSKATQEEIDTILEKISEKGYESLTKDEKETLFNASKK